MSFEIEDPIGDIKTNFNLGMPGRETIKVRHQPARGERR